MSRPLLVLGAFLLGSLIVAADRPPSKADIARLIKQLGSAEFEERESAETQLDKIGEDALAAIEKEMETTKDLEVRRRTERLAAAIGRRVYGQAKRLTGSVGGVNCVAFSPRGKF